MTLISGPYVGCIFRFQSNLEGSLTAAWKLCRSSVSFFPRSDHTKQTWREFICMAVGTILGVSYRKQTASFV